MFHIGARSLKDLFTRAPLFFLWFFLKITSLLFFTFCSLADTNLIEKNGLKKSQNTEYQHTVIKYQRTVSAVFYFIFSAFFIVVLN